jgi:hypothetical protein
VPAAGRGSVGSYKGSGGDDDDVVRAEGVTSRVETVIEKPGSQAAAADIVGDLLQPERDFIDLAAAEVNLENLAVDAPGEFGHERADSSSTWGRIANQAADDKALSSA